MTQSLNSSSIVEFVVVPIGNPMASLLPPSPHLRASCSERVLKSVIFYRHGQGKHNLVVGGKQQVSVFDPELTTQGEAEAAAAIAQGTPPPQLAILSPLWRALQTADLALATLLGTTAGEVDVPRIALEDAREANNKSRCNHRRSVAMADFC
jgi:hypothetical protein